MENKITIKQYIQAPEVKSRIKDLLKDKEQQFVISLLSTINSNALLAECSPQSIMNAALTAASMNLPINQNLGFAYIIPYKNKKGEQMAQFQMGYKGFIQLAQRSGQFKTINVSDVRTGEIAKIDRLSGDIQFEWKEDRLKLPVIGYVGYMELNNGFRKTLYMTIEELKAHGTRFSQSMKKGYGLWKDDFDAMASKTVIKLLLAKYAPLTVDMQKAQLADQSIVKGEGEFDYVDNEPEMAADVAKVKERERIIKHINDSKTVKELGECFEFLADDETKKLYAEKLKTLNAKK